MKLKTFRGATIAEALAKVKQEFGKDAVILSTRAVPGSKVLGIGKAPAVEITAARDASDLPPVVKGATLASSRRPRGSEAGVADARTVDKRVQAEGAAVRLEPRAEKVSSDGSARLLAEVGEVKSLVAQLLRRPQSPSPFPTELPPGLLDTYQTLVQNAVADSLARRIVQDVREKLGDDGLGDRRAVRRELASAFESMLPIAGPVQVDRSGHGPKVIALVGPTGVGKTTTIAKLAANFSLRERVKVGLVTIDTYRIAATQQLKTYADIMNIPMGVASSPRQLRDAMDRMSACDVVFLDTSGRSQRDGEKIDELKSYFLEVTPDEIHLVLSATTGDRVLEETIDRFRVIGIDRLIFTKIDEAIGLGVILECLERANLSLSYVTMGQNVPEDIRAGEAKSLARMVMPDKEGRAVGVGS